MLRSDSEEIRLVGESTAIQLTHAEIECAGRTDAKVLITGESGVGKDVAARLIHQRSTRAGKPFVAINCAGVPDSLLESELFGYVRGSFTGAFRDKAGLLEMAPNGTVFLDEVGEMSTRMQMVLLRFLETGEIQRIGAQRPHTHANVRLITATNRDLLTQITAGAFREDLYYRLNVIRLSIAPLRERKSDIPLLVDHFLEMYSPRHGMPRPEVSVAAMDTLIAHRWPGNIRELRNVVERLTLNTLGRAILPSDLPADIFARPAGATMVPLSSVVPAPVAVASKADRLAARMFEGGESFWTAVYPQFMARDLTRDDLRDLVKIGMERSGGNYRLVVQLFNMRPTDYKRFLAFLRKHNCHLPFQQFRASALPPAYQMPRMASASMSHAIAG